MSDSNDSGDKRHTDSINYKIGQEIKHWRLIRKYTQEDLANKIGVPKQQILRYEQGVDDIYPHELYPIAKALSVNIGTLLPRQKVLKEDSRFDKEVEEILDLVRGYKEIENRELRKIIYLLIKSVQVIEKSSVKAARIEMAKNMLKVEFSVDIIYRATGLFADEYSNIEEKIRTYSIDYKVGQRIREVRLIRGYTQKNLADKLAISQQQIQRYEQGINHVPPEKSYAIAKALSVKVKILFPEMEEDCYEDKDNGAEKELPSLIKEYKKIRSQEARDELNALIESLAKSIQTYKKKVDKAERIKVAQNLLRLGISIDVISQITGLSTDEIA
ncbi:MAG: WO male-killing family protein Wmk [Wolbachia sp.]